MTRSLIATGALALLLLIAGCGQKGPLYLPDGSTAPDVPQELKDEEQP